MPSKRLYEGSEDIKNKRIKYNADNQQLQGSSALPYEIDFPRGGGSVTRISNPVDTKEISLDEKERSNMAKKRKLLSAFSSRAGASHRIEHLNYKRLAPGMKLLVRVVAVRSLCIIVSLPDQLLAHIPITQISSAYTSLLEAEDEVGQNKGDGDDAKMKQSQPPELSEMFRPGDFLSAVVISVHAQGDKPNVRLSERDELLRTSQRVELSIMPSLVNGSLSQEKILCGSVNEILF